MESNHRKNHAVSICKTKNKRSKPSQQISSKIGYAKISRHTAKAVEAFCKSLLLLKDQSKHLKLLKVKCSMLGITMIKIKFYQLLRDKKSNYPKKKSLECKSS
uniref:Uncharacterized protein n=1 Tax=Spongospora subterranea TaxID=70186 RepID=A0A0H5QS61_9EUKA|eukprot:CRZ04805.1 hypothetical protein [Spongospora subterranea]